MFSILATCLGNNFCYRGKIMMLFDIVQNALPHFFCAITVCDSRQFISILMHIYDKQLQDKGCTKLAPVAGC